jgi:hypothetical protein
MHTTSSFKYKPLRFLVVLHRALWDPIGCIAVCSFVVARVFFAGVKCTLQCVGRATPACVDTLVS